MVTSGILPSGNLVIFLKQFNKQKFRLYEEEFNLIKEIYFNNAFGSLPTNLRFFAA